MAKKGSNDKKEAGNAKKAAVKAEKDNKKAVAVEADESDKWAQGAKGKNNKKDDAEAKKVITQVTKRVYVLTYIYRLLLLPRRPKLLNF